MNESQQQSLAEIAASIHTHRTFLVATHVRPDGDAIGSVLAMTAMLHRIGKHADPFCQDPAPPGQEFLEGSETIRPLPSDPSRYDAAILVDCGEFSRVGAALEEAVRQVGFVINIDHHISRGTVGDVSWVNSSASSTCEMLYDLCLHLEIARDPALASHLYTGLLTDTGSFHFSNTNRRVLEIATDLVAAGAQPAFIAEQIYDSASPQRLRLLARVLSSIAFFANDRLATASLTQQMFVDTGTSPVDSEGFISHLRSVRSVELAMLFREDAKGVIHVSLRSKGSVDVAAFAQLHKGGGHRRAAAFRVSGPMEAVRDRFTQEALSYLESAPGGSNVPEGTDGEPTRRPHSPEQPALEQRSNRETSWPNP